MTTRKKYALALSGGGFKGAYQLGALRFLKENWQKITGQEHFHFDLICGVSAGALNGILLACNRFDELNNLWQQVYEHGGQEIYQSNYINNEGKIQLDFSQLKKDLLPGFKVDAGMVANGAWNSIRRAFNKEIPGMMTTILQAAEKDFDKNFPQFKSLASNQPLEKKLSQYVRLADIPADVLYKCGLVSLDDGLYYSLSHKDFDNNNDFVQAILASASMPVIWAPVPEIHLPALQKVVKSSVDGGIRNISPLGDVVQAINADPDNIPYEVIIINCNSGYISPLTESWNIADIALRALTEITLAEIFNDDIREFLKMNDFVQQAAKGNITLNWKGTPRRYFDYKLISPNRDELGDTLDSRPEVIETRLRLGYEQAQKAYENIGVDGISPLSSKAT
ncbi:MAG TPA: patatin-like phospholipase family protein [Edaphocola sp.]|nr:patatin-like phospholipase family protein [Edaphocola sp.]